MQIDHIITELYATIASLNDAFFYGPHGRQGPLKTYTSLNSLCWKCPEVNIGVRVSLDFVGGSEGHLSCLFFPRLTLCHTRTASKSVPRGKDEFHAFATL